MKPIFFVLFSLMFLVISECKSQVTWEKILTFPVAGKFTQILIDSLGSNYISILGDQPSESYGIYRTDDNGDTWLLKNNGLGVYKDYIFSMANDNNGFIYAGSKNAIFKSADRAESWSQCYLATPYGVNWNTIRCGYDSIVLAGGSYENGIVRSTDQGNTWTTVLDLTGLPGSGTEMINDICFGPDGTIFASSRIIYAVLPGKLYFSNDTGLTWHVFSESTYPTVLKFDNYGRLLRGEYGFGIYRFDFTDSSWTTPLLNGISPVDILVVPDNKILIGCGYISNNLDGVMLSNDGGENYTFINEGLHDQNFITCMGIDITGRILLGNGVLYRSVDTLFTKLLDHASTKSTAFWLYPNPCNGLLTIESNINSGISSLGEFRIFDARGICVKRLIIDSFDDKQVDLTDFPTGFYCIKNNNNFFVKFFLIQ